MKKYLVIFLTVSLSLGVLAQNETKTPSKGIVKNKSNKEVKSSVLKQLKEIFGDHYQTSIKERPDQIKFYTEFYQRCEFIPLSSAPSEIKNISSLALLDKYNPSEIHHDNLNKFNANNFNVLKYRFNYYNKKDQYYKIYNTITVLKINKINK